jgi:hypothetical protein
LAAFGATLSELWFFEACADIAVEALGLSAVHFVIVELSEHDDAAAGGALEVEGLIDADECGAGHGFDGSAASFGARAG